ncbi:MAG: HAMP domain-containing sensor histidine kinase [Anaerolineae bacterium]
MGELSNWLEETLDALVQAAAENLSHDANVKPQLTESVRIFFHGFLDTVRLDHFTPLQLVLTDWVKLRSSVGAEETSSLIPLLTTLKQIIWMEVLRQKPVSDAVILLTESDRVFTEAVTFLSKIENEAFLDDMRQQLEKAQSRIRHLDKSKSNFIAVAAHELRTPLTLVEGYIDMIANSPQFASDSQGNTLVNGVRSGTRRLQEIINDIIDVSLLDLNMMEFHFQPVWLQQVINAAERNAAKNLSNRNVNIQIEHSTISTQPTIADPDRLLEAIQKVIMNAVKYTPDGGDVIVQGRSLPGFTDIMIIDNGIGIDPTNLPHIFDTFSALGDSSLHSSGKTKFKGGGPGLGLPIAKGIIDAHGGTIWAESEGYDESSCPGSTFHIMIPMHDTTTSQAPQNKRE